MKLNGKVFTILSILAIIGILILVKCYYFADIDLIKNVVIIPSKSETLFIDVSTGYIVSYIFYITQIYIPEFIKKSKFKNNTKTAINNLKSNINELIICIDSFYYIAENGTVNNSERNFIVIKLLNNDDDNSSCWCIKFEKADLSSDENLLSNIINEISKIKNTILLEYMDIEFIELLDNIQKEINFIKKILKSIEMNNDVQIISTELYNNLENLKKEIFEFNKYIKVENNNYQIATVKEEKIYDTMMRGKQKNIKKEASSYIYMKIDFNINHKKEDK